MSLLEAAIIAGLFSAFILGVVRLTQAIWKGEIPESTDREPGDW